MGRAMAVVLFTDLVGSTELRGRLGDDAAEELRRRHDDALSKAVTDHSGRVVKSLGDGIMATFAGAADAVAAAVVIQQAIDRLNRTGKAAVPLAVRVGLSAGDVAVENGDVHGTPVIEAARLSAAAGGGEILASEMVRWLARGSAAAFSPMGALELKGLAEPVPAVRVEWEPLATSAIPMPNLLTDVGRIFVGRDDQMERLGQLWKEAAAGERRVAFLAGEPGPLAGGNYQMTGAVAFLGAYDHHLGLLATALQRWDDAEQHFQAAAAMHERLGARAFLGRTRLEWAEMLAARKRRDDDERLHKLLDLALATARELRLPNIERRAVGLLQDCS